MTETTINLMPLEDEVLEAGPACKADIVIPCPPTPAKCKISELNEDLN